MQRDMNEHEEIAKALEARLSELRTHLVKVDRSLRKPLPADSEDQAIELENQDAGRPRRQNRPRWRLERRAGRSDPAALGSLAGVLGRHGLAAGPRRPSVRHPRTPAGGAP